MQALVTKDNVTISQEDKVHEGEYNVNCINFSFSEEYTNDLVKNAVFAMGDKIYQTSIINNQCNIPSEILSDVGEVFFGVYAYKVNDGQLELRYSPFPTRFTIISGSYNPTAEESQEITPTQFEQYMQALQNGLNDIQNAIDDLNQRAEDGEFDGKDGVGITTVTSGQSTQQDGSTVTPVTVNKTDGTQQTFNVSAKNGIDGQNGTDGNDGVTPNLQVGTVTTLEPNEQATVTRTGTDEEPLFNFGIPKGQQGEQGIQGIPGQDGQPGADGQPGRDGADGKDATINGQNTVEITTDNNITLDQQESVLKLGLNSQLIPKNDIEGTDNTFDDGLESPLYDLGGDGKSEQVVTQGHQLVNWGSPTVEGQGISFDFTNNILTVVGTTGATHQSVSYDITNIIKNNPGKTVYYKDDSHSITNTDAKSTAQLAIRYYDDTPVFYGIVCDYNDGQLSSYQIPSDTSNIMKVDLGVFTNNSSNTDINNTLTVTKPLLYFDNNNTYEPYTGLKPSPSSDYEQPINSIEGSLEFECRGKNLLNFVPNTNNIVTITKNNDGSVHIKGDVNKQWLNITNTISADFLKTNVNYCFSVDKKFDFRFTIRVYFDDEQTDYKNFDISPNKTSTNFILSRKPKTFYIYIYKDDGIDNLDVIFALQIEKGTQATSYEPYVEPNEVTFNLNDEKLRSVGDVKDELVVDLDTGDYYKVENVGEVVLDGSDDEYWSNVPDTTADRERYTSGIIQNLVYTGTKLCQSNYFKSGTSENYYEDGTIRIVPSGGVSIYDDLFTSMDNFKQWLSTHNTIVNYILKTPTTKKLGTLSSEDLAKLKTFKGYNNVTINTNLGLMNIRFTYGLDIKKYVDNKIAELSAQMIKGE